MDLVFQQEKKRPKLEFIIKHKLTIIGLIAGEASRTGLACQTAIVARSTHRNLVIVVASITWTATYIIECSVVGAVAG